MRMYATRRECEMILSCLYERMSKVGIDEMMEYEKLTSRVVKILATQCKKDNSTYTKGA